MPRDQNVKPYSECEHRPHMLKEDFEAFYYNTASPEVIPPHEHNFHSILFFRQGHVTYDVNGIAYDLLPSDILLIPPEVVHQAVFKGSHQYKRMLLRLSKPFMESIDPNGTLRKAFFSHDQNGKPVYLLRRDTARIFTMMETLISEASLEKPLFSQMARAQIIRVLVMLNRALDENSNGGLEETRPQYEIVVQAATYINAHIETDLSLDSLADRLFVSKFHLSRLFKQYMHITCHQYIMERRLIAARRLINEGHPLREVCKRCGYSNYSAFYRAFRGYYGISPRDFGRDENGSLAVAPAKQSPNEGNTHKDREFCGDYTAPAKRA